MRTKHRRNGKKIGVLTVLAVILSIVFIASAVLFAISEYEKRQPGFIGESADASAETLKYNDEEYVLKDNIETVLFLGLDKFEGEEIESYNNNKRADFLLLVVIDNENKTFSALHINRDTIAEMDVLGVSGDKVGTVKKQIALSHTYGNGKEVSGHNAANAVSKLLYNAKINSFISVTMDAVPIFNDSVGGVEVTVLDDIDDTLVAGQTVTLKGEQALDYVRVRYGLSDSSNESRMERQRQYMKALYEATQKKIESDELFIQNTVLKLNDYIESDIETKLQSFMTKVSSYEYAEMYTLDGETVKGEEFMEFYPDEESVKEIVVKLFYTPKD